MLYVRSVDHRICSWKEDGYCVPIRIFGVIVRLLGIRMTALPSGKLQHTRRHESHGSCYFAPRLPLAKAHQKGLYGMYFVHSKLRGRVQEVQDQFAFC